MEKHKFYRQTEQVDETIKATHDPIKEWVQDPKGYYLIRINREKKMIEAGFVTNDHVIRKIICGQNAIEIYNTIIRKGLLSRLEHAAYLGKELYKAELALKYNKEYKQEFPLIFEEAKKVTELKADS